MTKVEFLEQFSKDIDAIKDVRIRIRIGDYRIGLFFEKKTIELARVLHRKEIYRFFP